MGAMEDAKSLVGRNLVGIDGGKIGPITAIYVGVKTGKPEWAAVNLGGLLGAKLAFAPVAQISIEGEAAVVAFVKKDVKAAPKPTTEGVISPAENNRLFAHYGIDRAQTEPSGSQDAALWLGP
ncbi:MAG: PRC-barrel domain-containing protein [Acidimicrobiia bacterium]